MIKSQEGFSAVELLITLFIAAIFVLAGYQLYSYVLLGGTETSQEAIASNIAYKYLRQVADTITEGSCAAASPMTNQAVSNAGLPNTTVTVTVTCPYASGPQSGISLVQSSVHYLSSTDTETVSHALYVN